MESTVEHPEGHAKDWFLLAPGVLLGWPWCGWEPDVRGVLAHSEGGILWMGKRNVVNALMQPLFFSSYFQWLLIERNSEEGRGKRKNRRFLCFFNFGTIFSVPWQARIVEVREEIDRVLSQTADNFHKADSIPRLLQDKQLDRVGWFHVISCFLWQMQLALLCFSPFFSQFFSPFCHTVDFE